MKIIKVEVKHPIDFTKSPNKWYQFFRRWYIANTDGEIIIYTDVGVFHVTWKKGFGLDGRSGGIFVDPIFPNWGTDEEKIPVIVHDICFFFFVLSFQMSNEMLRSLMEFYGTAQWRCNAVYFGVSTPIAYNEFGCKNAKEMTNKSLCNMTWDVK